VPSASIPTNGSTLIFSPLEATIRRLVSRFKNICFWRDWIVWEGPLILRGLREQIQRGFWRMPEPTV
jgi:hypothetical protein